MGFWVTTLIFLVIGIVASLCTRVNLMLVTFFIVNLVATISLLQFCLKIAPNFGYYRNSMLLVDVLGNKRKCDEKLVIQLMSFTRNLCHFMWAIVYLAQMKPLIVPVLNEGE
ncbi:V-type proton ATPase subunit e1 [Senna tora]|uniref:V-type proton ATPase subunit e1 n=1 Tax=Senna tora TaxID=362788 RepID=A0A834U4L3_9FABA|nr:V-type proton ATPase subunit e1 [Senna tora]